MDKSVSNVEKNTAICGAALLPTAFPYFDVEMADADSGDHNGPNCDTKGDSLAGITTQQGGLLSDRSRRFYDGTYKWNGSSGYWDDAGTYHDFNDPDDKEAFPPTPGPVGPFSMSDDDVEPMDICSREEVAPQDNVKHISQKNEDTTRETPHSDASLAGFLQDGLDTVMLIGDIRKTTVLKNRDGLFPDHPDRERLLNHLEGILVGRWMSENKLSFEECYELCGVNVQDPSRAGVDNDKLQPSSDSEETPLMERRVAKSMPNKHSDSIANMGSIPENGSQALKHEGISSAGWENQSSPLSDCPSDLSEWSVAEKVKQPALRDLSVDSGIDIQTQRRSQRLSGMSK